MTSIPLPTLDDLALTAGSGGGTGRALRLMTCDSFAAWQETASAGEAGWVEAMGFSGKPGTALVMPDSHAIGIVGDTAPIWDGAAIAAALPPGSCISAMTATRISTAPMSPWAGRWHNTALQPIARHAMAI